MVVLVCGSALYVMYARGVFERTQRLVLMAENSEGVVAGMDLTFSGFPIGRVRRVELGAEGTARILVDVPREDAHWLRTSSVFTLVRDLVGGANLRAYSGVLTDPPLADGAERTVLGGDTTAELPRLVGVGARAAAEPDGLTAADSALAESLANVRTTTDKLNGPGGALGVLLGDAAHARQLVLRWSAPTRCWRGSTAWPRRPTSRCSAPTAWCRKAAPRSCSSTRCWAMRARAEEGGRGAGGGAGGGANARARRTTWARCAARSMRGCARSSSWSTR